MGLTHFELCSKHIERVQEVSISWNGRSNRSNYRSRHILCVQGLNNDWNMDLTHFEHCIQQVSNSWNDRSNHSNDRSRHILCVQGLNNDWNLALISFKRTAMEDVETHS